MQATLGMFSFKFVYLLCLTFRQLRFTDAALNTHLLLTNAIWNNGRLKIICLYLCSTTVYILFFNRTQLNSCGAVVTHSHWVQEVPSSIPGSSNGFMFDIFCLLLLWFYFLSKNTLFVTQVCNFFCNVNLFSILNILQELWPII